ncbi:DNA sulfur modification protein DndD [Inquilinus limosus]|uniref:DNA sulfur modification protein DndD n=1 Tax=Inquilinus limosus TaxID=171674 RepID=UPI003F1354C1
MYLRSIHFRDWKAYADATFEFPEPQPERNVVLIGAKNGFGKTSLLEGIVLGLFGRDGLPLVGRATIGGGDAEQRADFSYNDFLERAWHAQAREQGRTSASVQLVFEGDERIAIQRVWHFSGGGKHRREEEEVRIFLGPDEDLLQIPKLDDRDEFIRSFVARRFLPVHLAQFFLFDGEQVQRLAQRDMAAQVRLGIEGILGVPVLRELATDLLEYAKDRRRRAGNVGDEKIDRLRAEIRDLETREDELDRKLTDIDPQIEPLRQRRDQLVKQISSLHGGSYANLKELFETKERLDRDRERYKDELRRLLSFDVALALAGPTLRADTAEQLRRETVREKWELGKAQGDGNFDRFIASLDRTAPELEPPLTSRQNQTLKDKLRNAWQNLWYPAPENCADEFRHGFLTETDRLLVIERLQRIDSLAVDNIGMLLQRIEEYDQDIRKLDARIAQQRGVDVEAEKLAEELRGAQERLTQLESERRDISRELEGLRGQLTPKRQELGKLQESLHAAEPQLRRSALADRLSTMINRIVEEAFPEHIDDVARAMTEAYLAMAHKGVVKRIAIDPDCSVRLLSNGNRDLRGMDASAGESQIFALSLIAAIALVSKRTFPIVMDTPLARLDPEHRRNVLNYFTSISGQVVLLSHPDEVTGEYLDLIRPKVLASMHLEHEEIADGVGRSRLETGYYREVA